MEIMILGSSGQLGNDLKKKIKSKTLCRRKNKIDYFNKTEIFNYIKKFRPNIIINCVAYTDVNNARNEKADCKYLNFTFPKFLAKICKINKIILIHFSTDYVFDGYKKSDYTEKSATNPLNYYGKTKLNGDESIIKSGCKYFIFRISWLYNIKFKKNFIYKVREKILKRDTFSLPVNQIGAPISSDLVSNYIKIFIKKIEKENINSGIFNLTCKSYASRYQIGEEISKILKKKHNIKPFKILRSQKNETVKRPLNSRLKIKKIEKIIKVNIPKWNRDLKYNLINNK